MASFNRVTLLGNLTRDPQVKQLPSTANCTEFTLATNRRYKTQAGEDREEVCFVDCAAFGRPADVIAQYCRKGRPLLVEGRLKYDTWDDRAGGKRSKLSVVVENFQFIGGRDDAGAGGEERHLDHATDPRAAAAAGESGRKWRNPQQRLFGHRAKDGGGATAGENKQPAEQPFGEEKQFTEAEIPF